MSGRISNRTVEAGVVVVVPGTIPLVAIEGTTITVIAPRLLQGHSCNLEIRVGTGVVVLVAVPPEDLITRTGTEIRIVRGNGIENETVTVTGNEIETVPGIEIGTVTATEDKMTGRLKKGIAEKDPLQCLPPNPHQSVPDPLSPEIRHERLNRESPGRSERNVHRRRGTSSWPITGSITVRLLRT